MEEQKPIVEIAAATLPPRTVVLKNAGEFLNESLEIFKQHYRTLLSISAIIMAPSILFSVFSEKSVLASVTKTFGSYAAILFGTVLVILYVIISSWGQIALMYAVKDREKSVDISQAFALAWHKIGSYWWVALLSGFLVLGGFILFIIPGFLFALWFCLSSFVLVAEEEKGMNALLKSREYMRGKAWPTLWRFLVLFFSIVLFALLPGIFFGGLPEPWNGVITQGVFSFFVVPFNVVYMYLLYRNLVEIKGEFTFAPEKKTKRIFTAIGWLGILLPICLVILVGWLVSIGRLNIPQPPANINFSTTTVSKI